jgi:hypothetical protein
VPVRRDLGLEPGDLLDQQPQAHQFASNLGRKHRRLGLTIAGSQLAKPLLEAFGKRIGIGGLARATAR